MTPVWSAVTVDCCDPERVVRFWSSLLGREPGPSEQGWIYLGERGGAVATLLRGFARLVEVVPDADTAAIEVELSGAGTSCEPGAADVLWPGDTGPDNALLDADGWWFLDLEATDVRHAALAAAYTVLPFITCWWGIDAETMGYPAFR